MTTQVPDTTHQQPPPSTRSISLSWRSITLTVGLIGLVWIAFFSPYFRLQSVSIEPTLYISPHELQTIFGPLENRSLFLAWIQTHVHASWSRPLPAIKDVSYHFTLPNHCQISITEQSPQFLFLNQDQSLFIASDGAILNPMRSDVQAEQPDQLTIIHGIPNTQFNAPYLTADFLDQISQLRTNLNRYQVLGTLQLEFNQFGQYVLYLNDTLPIKLGDLTHIDRKFNNLSSFLTAIQNRPMNYIDLRIPDRVIVNYDQ